MLCYRILEKVHAVEDLTSASNANDRDESRAVTIAIQTDYRESEAQTDPYSPEFVLKDGEEAEPEVLRLANLKWST